MNKNTNLNNYLTDYVAYTDGSCNNLSPYGEGGAAYIILDHNKNIIIQKSKGFIGTTNNRMEMLAIISVVNWIPDGASVEICTDSQYCIDMLSKPKCPKKIFDILPRLKPLAFLKQFS